MSDPTTEPSSVLPPSYEPGRITFSQQGIH